MFTTTTTVGAPSTMRTFVVASSSSASSYSSSSRAYSSTRLSATSTSSREKMFKTTNNFSCRSFSRGRYQQQKQNNNRRKNRLIVTPIQSEMGEGGEKSPAESSTPYDYEGALLFLGLKPEATSEEIVKAKNDVLAQFPDDEEKRQQVDAAYDVLLLRSFTKRTSGQGVDEKVKYADVLTPIQEIKRNIPQGVKDASSALPGMPVFEVGSKDILTQSGVVFGALFLWVLAQGVSNPPGFDNPPGLQTAIAVCASIFLMNKRNVVLSRAVGITVAMLTIGCLVGGGVENILRVDIVPLGGLSSPSAVVTEFGILALFVAASSLY
ncbi:unnamed protein product [Bathycoccus prasinos]